MYLVSYPLPLLVFAVEKLASKVCLMMMHDAYNQC